MIVNLINALPLIRGYISNRTEAQTRVKEPVSAITVGFRLDQACLIAIHFDTREKHERDGTWDVALDGPTLEMPHWNEAYESANDAGVSFVLLTGEAYEISSDVVDDEAVAGVFGEALLTITLDALAAGVFDPLPLRDDCQLDLEEFDGMWAWPNEAFDSEAVDRPNEIRRIRLAQLEH